MCYHIAMKTKVLAVVSVALAFAGCFTVSETPFPDAERTSLKEGQTLAVQLSGFEASVTTYVPIYGYETVHTSVPCRRHRSHGSAMTVMSETYVPHVYNTSAYIDRASDAFEKCGFVLKSPTAPQYRVDVSFSGPFVSDSEELSILAWSLFSLLTADYGVQTWTARMKIYDAAGKVCLYKDYTQTYESCVWGPIPLLSPGGSDKSNDHYMQNWCLSALTDLAVADATAFLAAKAK